MRRRDFITLVGTATTWPLAARAQQSGKVFHIGFLGISLDAPGRENGFTDGQNLVIEYRRSDDPRGVSVAGAELLRAHLDLIVAQGSEVALQAVIEASRTIPIVINYDPIGRGYVASLARPGGNITGVFYQQAELAAKKVELLTQAVPGRTSLGVLWDALVTDEFEAAQPAAKGAWVGASCRQARAPALQFYDPKRTWPFKRLGTADTMPWT